MSTPVYEDTTTRPDLVEDEQIDKSKRAHFISPAMNVQIWDAMGLASVGGPEGTRQMVEFAAQFKLWLTALCGHQWIPTGKPTTHDTCEECLSIANEWIRQDGS
jgi:hypothetical protein